MTKRLYYEDQNMKEFEAKILSVRSEEGRMAAVLDQTAFYPEGGGQPSDQGLLKGETGKLEVDSVIEEGQEILHIGGLEGHLTTEQRVRGMIDWERRYRLMRMHTGAHLLMAAVGDVIGPTRVVGSGIGLEDSRMDLKARISSDILPKIAMRVNELIERDVLVTVHMVSAEDAAEILSKYGKTLWQEYQGLETVRLVEMEGVGVDPCGGTHVARTSEIGKVLVPKRKSKGAGITRLRFSVEP